MAWSDSGQVTQSILGIKGLEEQKKSNRWSKLMDIANVLQNTAGLGADLWKTVSGRKYQTEEADRELGRKKEYASFTNVLEYGPDSLKAQYEKGLAEMDLTYKQKWLDYQNEHPGKPADQLYAEWLMSEDGKAWQAEQERLRREGATFDHSLRMKEIMAGQGGGMSEDAWKTYDNAIARAISTFYEQDETRKYVLRKGATQAKIRDFLNGFLDPAFTSANDANGLKKAFELWLNNPDFPGGDGTTQKDDQINALVEGLLKGFAELAKNNPRPEEVTPNVNPIAVPTTDTGGAGTALGSSLLESANREAELEEGLKWFVEDASVDAIDKELARIAYNKSKKVGFLSNEDYRTFMTVLDTLRKKYGGIKATK